MTSLIVDVITLQTWIPSIVQSLEERIHSRQQQLYILMMADLPPLAIDASVLERLLIELLTNVCNHTPAKEQIVVSADAAKDTVQISISNSDGEYPIYQQFWTSEACYYVLENHSQANNSQANIFQQGNAPELETVQKLAKQLGVSIQLESAANQTTFTIQFPHKFLTNHDTNVSEGERIILLCGTAIKPIG